jgi:hypothetical protein
MISTTPCVPNISPKKEHPVKTIFIARASLIIVSSKSGHVQRRKEMSAKYHIISDIVTFRIHNQRAANPRTRARPGTARCDAPLLETGFAVVVVWAVGVGFGFHPLANVDLWE